jgi:ribosomal protein S18 acetylase RimI-like enzyme
MVGFIHARLGDSGECLLDKLYVAPEYQHQGVGEALFLSVRDWAQRRCLTSITLRVNRNNERAIRAYQKYGFRIVGEDRKPIGEGYVMDDFIMKTSI